MAENLRTSWWLLRLMISLAISGAYINAGDCTFAQITPDGTLPNNSTVKLEQNTKIIEGGTQAGSNLFHSFEQFSVPTGSQAYFNNALDIQNIISRVTGSSPSLIDGLIKANGSANLFFLNPNGIIFGPNAQLDIKGSFIATTANRLKFADGAIFSAFPPQSTPLLTVNVPIGLQFEGAAEPIGVEGSDLKVQPGKTLALVGGNVTLQGGEQRALEQANLTAPGGRIELGSVAGVGEVSLNQKDNDWVLGYASINNYGDIRLQDKAYVDVNGAGGGDVQIQSSNLILTGGSLINANTQGTEPGGEVLVHTTEAVTLTEGSQITANVLPEATGAGGNVTIETGQLNIQGDRSRIRAGTFGKGQGGNLTVGASEFVELAGTTSGLFTETRGAGNAGKLTITTQRLSSQNGARVSTSTLGEGQGGNLSVTAADSVELIGAGSSLSTGTRGARNAGNLTIDTRRLSSQNGATVSTSTLGEGQGGNLSVTAADSVELIGAGSSLSTGTRGAGNAGNLTITTRRLSSQNGATVSTSTLGEGQGGNLSVIGADSVELIGADSGLFTGTRGAGNAGNLRIDSKRLSVRDGALVLTTTSGKGQGGNLFVIGSDLVELQGRGILGGQQIPSLSTQTKNVGNAGDLTIITGQLIVGNGAQISTGSFGQGKSGEMKVNAADSVELIGADSGLFTETSGAGNAGNLRIDTKRLGVRDGAQVSTGTLGKGQGGNLFVIARDLVELQRTGISSINGQEVPSLLTTQTKNVGDAGELTIITGQLIVGNGAQISTISFGQGKGGEIRVNASDVVNIFGVAIEKTASGLFSRTYQGGLGGNIIIDTNAFRVADNGVVDARTFGEGKAGNITVNVKTLEAVNGGQILANAFKDSSGFAGDITVNATDRVTISGSAPFKRLVRGRDQSLLEDESVNSGLFVRSQGSGSAGNLQVQSPLISLDKEGQITAETASGNGGNITLQDLDFLLLLSGNNQISATAGTNQQGGDGGNITINAPDGFIAAKSNENNDITANAYSGKGGTVTINISGIFGIQPRSNPTSLSDITASSQFGVNGTVEINTPDVDPNSGLVNLPTVPVDTRVAQGCTAGSAVAKSSFTITGRGGLPPNPGEALSTDAVQVDLVTLKPEVNKPSSTAVSTNPINPTPDRIVEATGWVIAANGDVILTSSAPTVTPHSSWQRTADCRALNQHQGS
ncbi:two-partner secretion domain-containing protein [Nostoc sp.]|uniref:two-partner secretion domain-containing protein n=1 Tax=Nostoc sp. TaxID=1180 RepID=UPI002FF5C291